MERAIPATNPQPESAAERRPLRLLFATPHFFDPASSGPYGSQTEGKTRRAASVARCITALHETFGATEAVSPHGHIPVTVADDVDFVAVTTRDYDLLDALEPIAPLFRHVHVDVDPPELGFATLRVLAEHLGDYDYYCYLEDDVIIRDPMFFVKLAWFTRTFGDRSLLQPNRYEVSNGLKVYPDGPQPPAATAKVKMPRGPEELTAVWLGVAVRFARPSNPHAACWFANRVQMQRMAGWKRYGVPSGDFIGLYESACSLAMMHTLRVYKPAPPTSDLLEVQHRGSSYLEQWALEESPAVLAAKLGASEQLLDAARVEVAELNEREARRFPARARRALGRVVRGGPLRLPRA